MAEEAALTAEAMGATVRRVYDVGVAGIHRLLRRREEIQECHAAVVVAGMEGALASALGGLVGIPVVAVPTSVGYGANFKGVSALLAMVNSCASNVADGEHRQRLRRRLLRRAHLPDPRPAVVGAASAAGKTV